eukprot:TRINITY_DN13353_c0_g1_i1.p1 TRINITY_DN13353_c0_g1~~TRINITY_DN13353_c0_g1_i1.p1  ORF type:complete len:574 (-),score=97.51 TRINITY_DN13353_c0_g1_i1:204-1871(-)
MMFCTLYSEIISHFSENHHFLITIMHTKRWPVHPEVNDVVGNFSQTVLLEVDLRDSAEASFEAHCRRVTRQLTSDLDNAAFAGTDVAQEINRNRGTQFQAVAPFAFTSTLSFDGLSTIPEMKEVTPFSGRRNFSIVTVPHTWMDHQVAEDCGELLYNFDVLDGKFDPVLINAMVEAYEKFLYTLCDPKNWQGTSVESLFDPGMAAAALVKAPKNVVQRNSAKAQLNSDRQPTTEIEKAVASEFANALKISSSQVTLNANFFDLGGNSLTALQLIMSLKSKLKVSTTAVKFFENPTVAGLCENSSESFVTPKTTAQLFKPSLVNLRQSEDGSILFLIHAAGASVLSYRTLAQQFTKFSVIGVDDGAMLDDEVPFVYSSIEQVAASYTEAICEHLRKKNINTCYIGGWSFGGVVTIEVVKKMEAMGFVIPTCFLFDSPIVRTDYHLKDGEFDDDEEKERLEELLGRTGSGATRAIAHFTHCTSLLRKHKTAGDRQLGANLIHFLATETTLPVKDITELGIAVTRGQAVLQFTNGTHFTLLTDPNIQNVAKEMENFCT